MKALLVTLAGIAALAATLLVGCDQATVTAVDASATPTGKQCTIQFRRGDALGAGANLPVSPMTGGINGADVAISGTFKTTREDWVIITRAGREVWIPKSSILLIEFQ